MSTASQRLRVHVTRACTAALAVAAPAGAFAQTAEAPPFALNPITVTATRSAARAFDVPASIDVIDAATIHDGNPQVNLSETWHVRSLRHAEGLRRGRRPCQGASAGGHSWRDC